MRHRTLLGASAFALAAMAAAPLGAQSRLASTTSRASTLPPLTARRALPHDSLLVRSLEFRNIGPASMSGRIIDIAVPEAPASARGSRLGNTIYVAVATGGIWKSTNGGIHWSPITDSIPVGSLGAVAVAPSNGDVVWVGSGEAQNMRSSSWGVGVFKSTDGGRTWSKPMLPRTQHIGRIAIDPRNPDVVFVAAVGPLWAPGGERGLFRTADGGATWQNVLSVSQYTGVTEVVVDPRNPDVVYAATLQRERRAYGFLPGGTESAIYKSTDNGRTFTKLTNGLPTGELGRIGLSVCRSQPNTLYAVIHAKGDGNGVYRTDDAGATWRKVNGNNGTAWFYGQIRCNPQNPEHVIRLNVGSQESRDGGRTWTNFATGNGIHVDHHALWINPEAPDHLILGNDGGLDITHDGGSSWQNVENIVGAQFYAIAVDDAKPFYNVYGGLQDNSTYAGPNRTRNTFGPTNADWWRMAGGDGFFNMPDPFDHNIVYAESQEGGLVRHDARLGQNKSIKPIPKPGERHRYNWSAPIVPSRHTRGVVYFAANIVFRSPDRGDTWEVISPDLTRAIDRNDLPMRGAVPSRDALGLHEGTALFGNISTMDESPRRAGLLVTGTDDGVVSITRDNGRNWHRVMSFPGVPDTTYVSRVIWSAHQEGTIYASFDGHRSNDFKPYVLKSTDYGRTWTNITGNLPDGGSVQVVREHHREPNLLFAGTEFGVYFSVDGGKEWTRLKTGMPTVPVWDLVIQPTWNDLVLGTHGRGVYIMDDITPLEKLAEAKRAPVAYLFPARNEINLQLNGSRNSGMGSTGYVGENPPNGVMLTYLMNDGAASARASLDIVDSTGTVVRSLPVRREVGMHRTVWDFRVGPPLTGPFDPNATQGGGRGGRGGGGGFGGFGGGNAPAMFQALPGTYTARLTVTPTSGNATVLTQKFTIAKDPLVALSNPQLVALNQYRLGVARLQRTLAQGNAQIDSIFNRFQAVRRTLQQDSSKLTPTARAQVDSIEKSFAELATSWGPTAAQRLGGGGGRRGGGPPNDDDETPQPPPTETIAVRAGRLGSVMNVSFMPSPWQSELLRTLPGETNAALAKARTLSQLVTALEQGVR